MKRRQRHMKKARSLSALALAAALCVSLAAPAFGASPSSFAASGGKVYYSSDGASITIESADSGVTAVTIPEKIGSLPVKAIGYSAFKNCAKLGSVSVPAGVSSIGGYAFSGTPWLNNQSGDFVTVNGILILCRSSSSSIRIPTGTTAIGSNAFDACAQYFSVTVPSTVSVICCDAFYGCKTLTALRLADGLCTISDGAFGGCTQLSSVTLPETVSSIGALAFYGCTALRSAVLSKNLAGIDYQAFSGCTALASVDIPQRCAYIGTGAFKNCSSLSSVSIPRSVSAIRDDAFLGCASLYSVSVPPEVKTIGKRAFGWRSQSSTLTGFAVSGASGSAAESYASANGFKFSSASFPSVSKITTKFSDVPSSSWCYAYVAKAVSLGLINGKTASSYVPSGGITYAEAVKLAACLRQRETDGAVTLRNGSPWYSPYVDYAVSNGIIPEDYSPDWNSPAARADVAAIFAAALPSGRLAAVNDVADGSIPDVPMSAPYASAVYSLYRAGILMGSGQFCAFRPDSGITRAEAAALISRMADGSLRISLIL
jgi:hypothetical protein